MKNKFWILLVFAVISLGFTTCSQGDTDEQAKVKIINVPEGTGAASFQLYNSEDAGDIFHPDNDSTKTVGGGYTTNGTTTVNIPANFIKVKDANSSGSAVDLPAWTPSGMHYVRVKGTKNSNPISLKDWVPDFKNGELKTTEEIDFDQDQIILDCNTMSGDWSPEGN